jgi:16S rRNA (uracil1498-N3)-methyltransferase
VGPADLRPSAHVFCDDLESPLASEDDAHHLVRVLRLARGELVTVADGQGQWRPCRVAATSPRLALEPDGPVRLEPPATPAVSVGFALTKGGRPEWVVQKLTELGVDRVVPFVARRSVVRWEGERARRQAERLRAVARQAAMQSRRARLPEVAEVVGFFELVGSEATAQVALADRDGTAPSLELTTVLVGPEGGWSEEELALGMARVRLGTHVLRSETAAVAAAALVCGLRAGLVKRTQGDGQGQIVAAPAGDV